MHTTNDNAPRVATPEASRNAAVRGSNYPPRYDPAQPPDQIRHLGRRVASLTDWSFKAMADALGYPDGPRESDDLDYIQREAMDFRDGWTQDHDGTVRFNWMNRAELEAQYRELVRTDAEEWDRMAVDYVDAGWMRSDDAEESGQTAGWPIPGSMKAAIFKRNGRKETDITRFMGIALKAFDDPEAFEILRRNAFMVTRAEYKAAFAEFEKQEAERTAAVLKMPLSEEAKTRIKELWGDTGPFFDPPRFNEKTTDGFEWAHPGGERPRQKAGEAPQGANDTEPDPNGGQDNVRPDTHEKKTEPPKYKNPSEKRANKILSALMADNDAELRELANSVDLIDGLLPDKGVCMVYGASGVFKSFDMVAAGASVATGKPFAGLEIGESGAVVYVAAEGGAGVRKRLRGWEVYHGIKAHKVRILPMAIAIDDKEDRRLLRLAIEAAMKRTGEVLRLIVIDTLSQTTGGDDNSNSDMAKYATACNELKEHFGCTVVFVHHTGKDEGGFRGAYSLRANVDVVLRIASEQPMFSMITSEKVKDGEPIRPIRFRMEQVDIGLADRKGRPITTLVPRPMGMVEEGEMLRTIGPRERILMDALKAQTGAGGHPACDRTTLRKDFIEALVKAEPDATDEAAGRGYNRALAKCAELGLIRYDKKTVTRTS